jgi:hypothetical protein
LDAQATEDETFVEFLRKIDAYIQANMQGYADTARDVIASIVLTPLQPCSIFTGGLMSHWAFLRSQKSFTDASTLTADGARIPLIIQGERFCNELWAGFDPVHTYVRMIDTYESSIREFHNYILGTAERFRHSVDSLINYRRLLTDMADLHPDASGLTDEQINTAMGFVVDAHSIQRKEQFFRQNKLDVEKRVGESHYRVEALRQQLIRQFDELYARRVGWGYRLQNPGVRFVVYIRHAPCNNVPFDPSKPEIKKEPKNRQLEKRAAPPSNNSCVVSVDSIDFLNEEMEREFSYSYKIIKLTERENVLKREIEHLRNTFNIWLETSTGWYNSYWYLMEYKKTATMFSMFNGDLLENPRYASVNRKLIIIKDFSTLLQNEMKRLQWYYDPQRSFDRVRNFIHNFYHGQYPVPPPNNGTIYHDELR